MEPLYALKKLYGIAAAVRVAQKDYYNYKGDPKTDEMKRGYLATSKRFEADLDNLLGSIRKLFPQVLQESKSPELPGGAMSVAEINEIRLSSWKDTLTLNSATPQVVLAVGMGENVGKLVVLCTQDLTNDQLQSFLNGAVRQLQGN